MIRGTSIGRLFAAAAIAVACGGTATAGLLPAAGTPTVTPEAGNFRWTYGIVLPTDMRLQSGNYFTIYDFAGYVPGGESAPAGWTLTTSNTGMTDSRLNPDDDPNIVNLTWTYTGATTDGQTGVGNFWAYSTSGQGVEDSFTAVTRRISDGLQDANITTTTVPTGGNTPPPPVPEPATLLLAGLGLPAIGLGRVFRRKK